MGIKRNADDPVLALEAVKAARARFGIASDGELAPVPEDIEMRKAVQRAVREAVVQAAGLIEQFVEDSREKSLAFTSLEEGLMWVGKSIFK